MKARQAAAESLLPRALAEVISEAAYQLADCQENQNQGGIIASLEILQAANNSGGKAVRSLISQELESYCIPYSALQIAAEGGRL